METARLTSTTSISYVVAQVKDCHKVSQSFSSILLESRTAITRVIHWSPFMHIRYLIAAFLLAYVVLGNTATAALVISMSPTTQDVVQGGVGVLEFSIDTTGMGPIDLAAFNVTITVPDTSGITFIGGDDNVSNPYVFAGESVGLAFVDPMFPGTNSGDILDLSNNLLGFTTLAEGTYGLGRMFFSVDANAPVGLVNFTLDATTSFTDVSAGTFAFMANPSFTLGEVQVTAVPEPSSIALLAIAGSGLFIARRRKQRLLRAAN